MHSLAIIDHNVGTTMRARVLIRIFSARQLHGVTGRRAFDFKNASVQCLAIHESDVGTAMGTLIFTSFVGVIQFNSFSSHWAFDL